MCIHMSIADEHITATVFHEWLVEQIQKAGEEQFLRVKNEVNILSLRPKEMSPGNWAMV